MEQRPIWKQPQGMVLIAGGAIVLLATLWIVVTTLRPATPAVAEAPPPANHVDENALIAANAEPQNSTAAAAPAPGAKPPEAPTAQPASAKPESSRFSPDDIAAEAQAALDRTQSEAEEAKPEPSDEESGK